MDVVLIFKGCLNFLSLAGFSTQFSEFGHIAPHSHLAVLLHHDIIRVPVRDAQHERDHAVAGARAAELAYSPVQPLLSGVLLAQPVEDGVLSERDGHLQQTFALLVDVGNCGGVLDEFDDAFLVVGRDAAVGA